MDPGAEDGQKMNIYSCTACLKLQIKYAQVSHISARGDKNRFDTFYAALPENELGQFDTGNENIEFGP